MKIIKKFNIKLTIGLCLILSVFGMAGCSGDKQLRSILDLASMKQNEVYTKVVKTIQILDSDENNILDLQKKTVLVDRSSGTVYQLENYRKELLEQTGSSTINDYIETTTLEYFTNELHYYQENQEWQTDQKKISLDWIGYSFSANMFEKGYVIKNENNKTVLKANVIRLDEFFGSTNHDAKNVTIEIVIDEKGTQLEQLTIVYHTNQNRVVQISLSVEYSNKSITLPTIG